MPLMECQTEGESGWKWGESGHCFIGENAKEMATEQAQAIYAAGYKGDAIADCYKLDDFADVNNA